ncbi:MAG: ACT domain-containing protein, partial [Verrucomicrobia bacterium]|nr:ACT domain-containing protein [Verrucomicrobiota bacterium]
DVPDKPANASKIFRAIASANINIDMIVQNVSWDGKADISFTLHKNDLAKAKEVLKPTLDGLGNEVSLSAMDGIAKVSAVGIGMRSHSGVAAQLFTALGEAGINIQMITTSEIKISVTIVEAEAEEAARVVHRAFDLHHPKGS